ncbi:hypothetical protein Zmor_002249 [Zophobas morio]|uniref:Uncharacterized protein n=1 Tax=Zophobas morio TaxID=2755281 RepID=A0AA38MTT2_9CUCU|nr:hypothetical protein Zmor_002249 [Zophobas morio]
MIGDSSSVTAAGRRSLKKNLEAEVAMGIPEKPRFQNMSKESMRLKRAHLRERDDSVESSPANVERSQSSCTGIILYIIAVVEFYPTRFLNSIIVTITS